MKYNVGDYVVYYGSPEVEIITRVTFDGRIRTNVAPDPCPSSDFRYATPIEIAKYRCENE